MLELDSAGSKSQYLNVFCYRRRLKLLELKVRRYGKCHKGTEASEEPTGSLTVSMPLEYSSGQLLNVSFLFIGLLMT